MDGPRAQVRASVCASRSALFHRLRARRRSCITRRRRLAPRFRRRSIFSPLGSVGSIHAMSRLGPFFFFFFNQTRVTGRLNKESGTRSCRRWSDRNRSIHRLQPQVVHNTSKQPTRSKPVVRRGTTRKRGFRRPTTNPPSPWPPTTAAGAAPRSCWQHGGRGPGCMLLPP